MLTGKRFKLETPTMAVEIVDGKRVAVTVSAGETIKVVSGPRHGDRMMDVLWNGRVVMMFAVDVHDVCRRCTGTRHRGHGERSLVTQPWAACLIVA
jgi:hypothetical protein